MIWVLLFYVSGLVLVLAEFLIPGMVAGIIGTTLIIVSAVIAVQTVPDYALIIILGEVFGVAVAVVVGMMMMTRSRLARRLVLETSQDPSAGWVAADSDQSLNGAEAKVCTALRPAGTILLNGRRIDAVSDGTFIDAGETVRVVEVHGSRVVVERV